MAKNPICFLIQQLSFQSQQHYVTVQVHEIRISRTSDFESSWTLLGLYQAK